MGHDGASDDGRNVLHVDDPSRLSHIDCARHCLACEGARWRKQLCCSCTDLSLVRAWYTDRLEELSVLWNNIDEVTQPVKSSAGAEVFLRPLYYRYYRSRECAFPVAHIKPYWFTPGMQSSPYRLHRSHRANGCINNQSFVDFSHL